MKNISLKVVTLGVFAMGMASSFSTMANEVAKPKHAGTVVQSTFSQYDTDNNGKLTENEVIAAKNELLNKAFKTLDIDGDASISLEEFSKFTVKK